MLLMVLLVIVTFSSNLHAVPEPVIYQEVNNFRMLKIMANSNTPHTICLPESLLTTANKTVLRKLYDNQSRIIFRNNSLKADVINANTISKYLDLDFNAIVEYEPPENYSIGEGHIDLLYVGVMVHNVDGMLEVVDIYAENEALIDKAIRNAIEHSQCHSYVNQSSKDNEILLQPPTGEYYFLAARSVDLTTERFGWKVTQDIYESKTGNVAINGQKLWIWPNSLVGVSWYEMGTWCSANGDIIDFYPSTTGSLGTVTISYPPFNVSLDLQTRTRIQNRTLSDYCLEQRFTHVLLGLPITTGFDIEMEQGIKYIQDEGLYQLHAGFGDFKAHTALYSSQGYYDFKTIAFHVGGLWNVESIRE